MQKQLDRFWAKVDKSGECWIWNGARAGNGYGQVNFGNKRQKAHRWIYEQEVGPIPVGMDCCHKCDVRLCVRPEHLFVGTRSDNMRDCADKGRNSRIGKSLQTHCSRGHLFDHVNTIVRPNGQRRCRVCKLQWDRAWKSARIDAYTTGTSTSVCESSEKMNRTGD